MGFRDISSFNQALLAKQGWRIMTEPDSLLAKVFKAKYFPTSNFLQAKPGHRSSYSWQSIMKASWILKKGCLWLIGNGKTTNIWSDRWLHPHGDKATWTPRHANTNLEKLQDLINPSSKDWNRQLISQNFYPIEAEAIYQIPLSNPMDEDQICWQRTKDGIYTVRSGYNAQIEWEYTNSDQGQTSNNNSEAQLWNNIWKAHVPPKQTHLIWRILHNAIPIKPNLITKGITCDSLCPRCNKATESIEHAFLHCEWVSQLWFSSPLTITTTNIKAQTFSEWLKYMLINANKDSIQIIFSITYTIWFARNHKVFQNVDIPVLEALNRALKHLSEYQHHNITTRPNLSCSTALADRNGNCWSPPPRNFLKLNVDAHLHGDGHWGFGMLLRSADGRCVGSATRVLKGWEDATWAEAVGISEALKWIDNQKLQNVIIESDAEVIVKAMQKKSFPRTHWGRIALSCVRDLDKLSQVSVKWVNRKCNTVAHELAHYARVEPNKSWPNSVPDCILTHILSDMRGVT
jgi:ribonuclease HI